ncbi:hypothetical protein TNCT_359021 [Trichonephila clavata]|uniref:Uncharacterized protein n=1 Tax=Trichonephila clavata TaxID=2740835 RepID=A0A8X6FTQ6_TRICU|nr:hypothetical protein TNCT_359021 [Trichonephila clavata]
MRLQMIVLKLMLNLTSEDRLFEQSIVPHHNRNRGRVLPPHSHHLFPPGADVLRSEAEKAQPSPGVVGERDSHNSKEQLSSPPS